MFEPLSCGDGPATKLFTEEQASGLHELHGLLTEVFNQSFVVGP
jgi:hypothetical protein